jgi:hypothetical protein
LRRVLWLAAAPVAALWLFGLVRFLRADGAIVIDLPRLQPPPPGEHDLAAWRFGPTLRVSSYDGGALSPHHPAFLIDERRNPALLEKWVSGPGDRQPWVEVSWREPRHVSRIVLHHAGTREDPRFTLDGYTLTCLGSPAAPLVITGNTQAVATHALDCPGATGLRLQARPQSSPTPVRLFELEVFGQ